MKGRRSNSGMTLLEVLVSLAIFALAATGFSAAYVNALHAIRATGEMSRHAVDWRLVRSIVVGEAKREIAEQGGELALGDRTRIAWKAEIKPTLVLDLFEVELQGEVRVDAGPALAHREVFRVLRPTWSGADERARFLESVRQRRSGRQIP